MQEYVSTPRGSNRESHVDDFSVPIDIVIGPPSSTAGDYHHLNQTTMEAPRVHDYADLRGPPYYNVPTPVAGPNGRTNTAGNEGARNDGYYQDLNNQTQDVHPYSRLRGHPRANQLGSVASNRSHVYEEIQ